MEIQEKNGAGYSISYCLDALNKLFCFNRPGDGYINKRTVIAANESHSDHGPLVSKNLSIMLTLIEFCG